MKNADELAYANLATYRDKHNQIMVIHLRARDLFLTVHVHGLHNIFVEQITSWLSSCYEHFIEGTQQMRAKISTTVYLIFKKVP